jgi:uncharacterized protein YndB with AHSA1/START domain
LQDLLLSRPDGVRQSEMNGKSPQGRTDKASRLIAGSPDVIYRALVDPALLMAWLPPAGMSGRALLFEPWESGRYRIELRYESAPAPGGKGKSGNRSDISVGRFLALEPGRRVVQSVSFESDDPQFAGEMIVTWSLEPAPGGTKVTVTAGNVPAGISAEDHQAGLASSLENLAHFLA